MKIGLNNGVAHLLPSQGVALHFELATINEGSKGGVVQLLDVGHH